MARGCWPTAAVLKCVVASCLPVASGRAAGVGRAAVVAVKRVVMAARVVMVALAPRGKGAAGADAAASFVRVAMVGSAIRNWEIIICGRFEGKN